MVTADQMFSLFGLGDHPLAAGRPPRSIRATDRDIRNAMQLGQRYGVYPGMTEFSVELTTRIGDWNLDHGRDPGAPVPAEVRARPAPRWDAEFFPRTRLGREPIGRPRAVRLHRPCRRGPLRSGVAFDDRPSPGSMSVSALWALANPEISTAVERCHDLAVADSLRFMEERAIYTRRGRNGVRQVKTHGIVAASFTHRDSRAGDPDLHTHVAIANKVQAVDDGAWLAIDGRIMFKANVTVSEFYNTALEKHLTRELGVRFVNRPGCDPERPVRESEGVDPALLERWSQRDKLITQRQGDLVADFQHRHGRTPTPTELHSLAQQATLQTREAKHEPRSLAEQRSGLGGSGRGGARTWRDVTDACPRTSSEGAPGAGGRRAPAAGVGRQRGVGGPAAPVVVATLARACRGVAPGADRRRARARVGPGPGCRPVAGALLGAAHPGRGRDQRAGGAAASGRQLGVHGGRLGDLHLAADPGRGVAAACSRRPAGRHGGRRAVDQPGAVGARSPTAPS